MAGAEKIGRQTGVDAMQVDVYVHEYLSMGMWDWRIGGLEDWRVGGLEDWM